MDRITLVFDDSITEGPSARALFSARPDASYDNLGNNHFNKIIVCADGSVKPYTVEDQKEDIQTILASTIGAEPARDYPTGKPLFGVFHLVKTKITDTYDLGNLPSPLQTRCEQARAREK